MTNISLTFESILSTNYLDNLMRLLSRTVKKKKYYYH